MNKMIINIPQATPMAETIYELSNKDFADDTFPFEAEDWPIRAKKKAISPKKNPQKQVTRQDITNAPVKFR